MAAIGIIHPELVPEPAAEYVGPRAIPVRPAPSEGLEEIGSAADSFVGIPLHLAEGDRRFGDPAVGEAHRIPTVLPALVRPAGARAVDVQQQRQPAVVGAHGWLRPPGRVRRGRHDRFGSVTSTAQCSDTDVRGTRVTA